MTPIQTDREAVERLALRSDATAAAHKATSPCCGEDDPCVAPACHFGEVMRGLQDGAATLRALRAALDAAEAERDALLARESDLLAENDALRFTLNNASADVKRLRRSWLVTIQTENSCPATGGGCLSKRCGCIEEMEMLMREDDARGAATEGGL